ncbi:MAG: patatin-like phospholipase family protein [Candidatus Omnitrophota bacterium]
MVTDTKRTIALVLSGGSARGLAHLGAIKVFKEEGITFDLIVGSSIGSLVGAVYALDCPLDEILKIALRTSANDIIDVTLSRMGLVEGNKLEALIRAAVGGRTFADVKIPLAIATVDIETGEEVCFTSGDLVKVIKASCSLPGIFKPVEIDGRLLMDGGIKHHLPTGIAKKIGADHTVAIDVGFCVKKAKIANMFGIIMQSIQILGQELSQHQSGEADLLIRPDLGEDMDQMAFDKASYIISKGEEAARAAVPQLKKLMEGRR